MKLHHCMVFSLFFAQVLSEKAYARENKSLFAPFDMDQAMTRKSGAGGFQNREAVEKWLTYSQSGSRDRR